MLKFGHFLIYWRIISYFFSFGIDLTPRRKRQITYINDEMYTFETDCTWYWPHKLLDDRKKLVHMTLTNRSKGTQPKHISAIWLWKWENMFLRVVYFSRNDFKFKFLKTVKFTVDGSLSHVCTRHAKYDSGNISAQFSNSWRCQSAATTLIKTPIFDHLITK